MLYDCMYGRVKLLHSHEKAKTGSQRCRTPLSNTTWCENLFRASAGAPYLTWAEHGKSVSKCRSAGVASRTSRPKKNPKLIFKSHLTSKNPRWNISTSDIIWFCPQLQVGHTMNNRQLILQSFAMLFLLPTVSGLQCLAFCRFWTMSIDTFRRRKTSQACKAWVVLGPNWLVYIWYLGI